MKDARVNPTLNDIKDACLDSEGYILFAGIYEQSADEKLIIKFEYRRHRFSLSDAKLALRQLASDIAAELAELEREIPLRESNGA